MWSNLLFSHLAFWRQEKQCVEAPEAVAKRGSLLSLAFPVAPASKASSAAEQVKLTGSNAAVAAWLVCMVKCLAAGKAKQKEAEMKELLVPPDLPIEMIAEEVKESWRLKEVHVEKLMQKVSCCISHYYHMGGNP
jgi:hypothetical protein